MIQSYILLYIQETMVQIHIQWNCVFLSFEFVACILNYLYYIYIYIFFFF